LTLNTPATVARGATPFYITVDPSGRFAYVTNESDSTVTIYSLNSQGLLVAIGSAPTGNTPSTVAVVAR
jgi:6-phosphogluconolactonase